MSSLDRFLATRYVKYGRHGGDLDCYGLVRLARHELFGLPLLPLFGDIAPEDKQGLTAACKDVSKGFSPTMANPAAIATAWRGKLCMHVGLVVEADERLWVLETNEISGPCLTPIPRFESRYTKVIYYDD